MGEGGNLCSCACEHVQGEVYSMCVFDLKIFVTFDLKIFVRLEFWDGCVFVRFEFCDGFMSYLNIFVTFGF